MNTEQENKDSKFVLGDNTFKVYTITYPTETNNGYSHWSDGLVMYIQKDDKTIKLNSEEIQDLVRTLPRTLGGTY